MVNKYKVELMAKGCVQRKGIYFDEVFASVARLETIWPLIAFATTNVSEIYHLDMKTAFLNGNLKELVYMT